MNLKKIMLPLWTVLCVIVGMSIAVSGKEYAFAEAETEGDFAYCYLDYMGGAGIVEYTGNSTDLVIPEKIGGYKVVWIKHEVFDGCSSLKSIKIPSGLADIEAYDNFCGCDNLTEIKADADNPYFISEDGILYDKEGTLVRCPTGKTGDITIPEGITEIAGGAFTECNKIKSVKLSSTVENIEGAAFASCDNLEKIDVDAGNPNFISKNGIIYNRNGTELLCCPGGKSGEITLPDGISKINDDAFVGCNKIEKVKLPSSVETIGWNPFNDCCNLKEINVDAGNPDFKSVDGILYNKDGTELKCCPAGKSGKITLPGNVQTIGNYAFRGCRKIESITLPSSLEKIESDVFMYCDNLKEINVDAGNSNFKSEDGILYSEDGVELIRYPDRKAEIVKIPAGVRTIGIGAFKDCTKIKEVELPLGVTEIKPFAFADCSSLRTIKFPAGLTKIGQAAFQGCKNLISVELPEGVSDIESYTFQDCKMLQRIFIPVSVTYIDIGSLFSAYNNSIKDVYYAGSKKQWKEVFFGVPTTMPVYFDQAVIHYNAAIEDIQEKPDTINVTVSFDSQGGYQIPDIQIEKGGSLNYIPVAARDGYKLQGWYTGPNGTGSMLTLETVIGENITYYAFWTSEARSMTGIKVYVSGVPHIGSDILSLINVRAEYSDGSSEQVYDYSVSQPVLSSGNNTVVVTCRGFTQSITIPVNEQINGQGNGQVNESGVNLTIKNILVSYTGGAVLVGNYDRFSGLDVIAEYSDGSTNKVQNYTLSTHTVEKGNNKVTVSYAGKTADFYVTGYQYATIWIENVDRISSILVMEDTGLLSALDNLNLIPTKSGYYFDGWYLDEAYTQKVTGRMSVSDGTRVYAKWEKSRSGALVQMKATIKKGKKMKLSVAEISSKKVIWKTSNKKIATVSMNGVVKAKKKGMVTIKAITEDGTVMTCKIKVKK